MSRSPESMKLQHSSCGPSPLKFGSTRFSFLCITLWLFALGVSGPPLARGGTVYDAQQIIVTNSAGAVTNFAMSCLNPDGAAAIYYWDALRNVFAVGRWTPSALYGMSAGYHEFYTQATNGLPCYYWNGPGWFSTAIEDNGDVSYCGYFGSEVGGHQDYFFHSGSFLYGGARGNGLIPCNGLFGWNPEYPAWMLDIEPSGPSDASSDTAPYFYGRVVTSYIQPQPPALLYYYIPYICNGSMQQLTSPYGRTTNSIT